MRIAKTAPFVGNTRSVVIMVMKWLSCRRGLVRRAGVEIRIPTNRCVVVERGLPKAPAKRERLLARPGNLPIYAKCSEILSGCVRSGAIRSL